MARLLAEFTPVAEKRFLGVDVNKDVAVVLPEARRLAPGRPERRAATTFGKSRCDKNGHQPRRT
jgi:hypothetical protein